MKTDYIAKSFTALAGLVVAATPAVAHATRPVVARAAAPVMAYSAAPVIARAATPVVASRVVRSAPSRVGVPDPGEYNVLLIVLDDFGTDKLKMYRENAETAYTPNLDLLWLRGIQFTNANVNPVCSPTRAAIMTGRHGMRTGVGTHISAGDNPPYGLPSDEMFLPELLKEGTGGAYATGAFGKWHIGLLSGEDCHAGENGFDRYQICIGNNRDYYKWRKIENDPSDPTECSSTSIPAIGEPDPYSENTWNASVTRKDAVNWIRNELDDDQPFFAYVAFNPPHMPQQVPPTSLVSRVTRIFLDELDYVPGDFPLRRHQRDIHDVMIEAVDGDIGRLLNPTTGIPQDQLDKTMVIVIGDNGTETMMIRSPQDPSHSKRSLYQGGVRVPMIVAGPLVSAANEFTYCHQLINAVDVWRTVANIAGLTDNDVDDVVAAAYPGESHPIDGLSFLAQIENPSAVGSRDIAFSEFFPNGAPPPLTYQHPRTVRDRIYKYIRKTTAPLEELYNVVDDPEEADNILLHASLTRDEEDALCRLQNEMSELSGGHGCFGTKLPTRPTKKP
jgi:arylsulfatase A-like enzyme